MKKFRRIPIIIAALMTVLILSSCSSWRIVKYFYSYHREAYFAEEFLPDDYTDFERIKYYHNKKILLFFFTDTMTVRVKYGDSYLSKKAELDKAYDYLAEPVESDMLEGHYLIPVTEFEYNGFHMRVADGGDYPHKFGIIGYNDETKEIAYLWFFDTDFDYIAAPDEDKEQAMIEFVNDNFKLK